jgi:hypothetical protein
MVRGWTEPVKGGKTEKIDIGRPARVLNCHSTLTRVAERRLTYTSNLEGEVNSFDHAEVEIVDPANVAGDPRIGRTAAVKIDRFINLHLITF